jgi:nucleoside-diphosphate-sugar epimerase
MTRVLITGGNGYIATSLFKSLKDKYDITTITRRDFDLTDYTATSEFFEGKYFDVVIHTAIVGGNRLQNEDCSMLQHNVSMYYNLISFQETNFNKFISFGSGAELDYPTTPYGVSKRIIAESMANRDNCLNLRIFAVFDEYELDRRFIKSNVIRYINKEDLAVYENKAMDFFYMEDLINLVEYYLSREDWLFNVIDCKYQKSHTLLEIAQIINKLDNYKVDINVGNREGKPYVGNYVGLPIPLVGLERAIQHIYQSLKSKA